MTENSTAKYAPHEESSDQVTQSDWFGQFSNEMIYRREYLVIYFLVSIMTLSLVIFDLLTHDGFMREKKEPLWFIILDVICVLFLIIEIFFRRRAHRHAFWSDPFNKFDVCVIVISCISVSMYPIWTGSDLFGACVLGTRYIAQTSRLLMFLKRWDDRHQAQKSARKDLVKFEGDDAKVSFLDPDTRSDLPGNGRYATFQSDYQEDPNDVEESSVLTAPPL